MERLTRRSTNGVGIYATPSGEPVKLENNRHKVLQKLADYEDQGLTPEEVKNLQARLKYQEALADAWESNAQSGLNLVHKYRELLTGAREELKSYKDAEEQGLLLRLPCKAGDTFLYEPMDKDTVHKLKVTGYRTIQGDWVVETSFGPVPFLCIGKTVFLTREAAEEALKGSGAE
jgi:hypothetical protein